MKSDKVISKISSDTESGLNNKHQIDFRKEYEKKFKNKLEQRIAMKWQKLNKKEDKMDIVWSLPPLFKGRQVNFVITFRNYFTISKNVFCI